ncbi:hypothetical protein PoB_005764400 [Plakobranchus ocellatus]|uniref:Uncharacterized protein n=1 Tax=Plakobranchus ocellatus TaxID=259542 RepID=A0AAV4CJU1_9GAST|nr:hypothetical protein PoB_005764400 [Plakobranchus ocellatus]
MSTYFGEKTNNTYTLTQHSAIISQQGDLRFSGPPSGQGGGGSNPRQKGLCRSQGELASHCATDTPSTIGHRLDFPMVPREASSYKPEHWWHSG